MEPLLPYDIFSNIIDQLASECCYEELSTLSQTCRILLQPCRLHLFSSINLGKRYSRRLTALISRDSAIQGYVKVLSYHTSNITRDLANALLLLKNVESFDLRGKGQDPLKWAKLPEHIQHALIHLFSSPSMTYVEIYNFDGFPTMLLSSCSNLESLKIHKCQSLSREPCGTILHPPPQLLSLDLSGMFHDPLLNIKRPDGVPMLDMSCLESLVIAASHEQLFEEILRSTTKLYSLNCSITIHNDVAHKLTIPLATLQFLHLEWWGHDTIAQNFPSLIRLLKTLVHPSNCIEELNLAIGFHRRSYNVDDLDWEAVDQILSDRQGFRGLKKLTIWSTAGCTDELRRWNDTTTLFDEIKSTKFPRLSSAANDYLEFEFTYS